MGLTHARTEVLCFYEYGASCSRDLEARGASEERHVQVSGHRLSFTAGQDPAVRGVMQSRSHTSVLGKAQCTQPLKHGFTQKMTAHFAHGGRKAVTAY